MMPHSITYVVTFVIALTLLPASSGSSLAQSNPTTARPISASVVTDLHSALGLQSRAAPPQLRGGRI
jgi:hypothetical protein